jgi:hypothetical protein
MSRGILKSALTTTIRLDLTYREPVCQPDASEHSREKMLSGEQRSIHSSSRDTQYQLRWAFVGDVQ